MRFIDKQRQMLARDKAILDRQKNLHPWLDGWEQWCMAFLLEGFVMMAALGFIFRNIDVDISIYGFVFGGIFMGGAFTITIIQQHIAEKLFEEEGS
jgi:hypothetical protein